MNKIRPHHPPKKTVFLPVSSHKIQQHSLTGRKIIFKCEQSPGDVLMFSAAVRDLKLSYPEVSVDVRTSCPAIFEHNPYITSLTETSGVEIYKAEYPLIHESNEGAYHFIHAYRKDMEDKLGVPIKQTKFWGDIHYSEEEMSWVSMVHEHYTGEDTPFWLICTGGKKDYTCAAEDSRIQTKSGYKKIKDVTNKDEILTEWGFKKCDGSIYKGEKRCLNITTRTSSIEVTPDHKFKIMDIDGKIKWKKAGNLKKGDYILGKRGDINSLDIKEDNNDKWFALGRLWRDGYIHKNSCYWIFSEDDIYSKKRITRWLNKKELTFSTTERPPELKNGIKRTKIDYRICVKNPFSDTDLPPFKKKGKWRENGFPHKYFCLNYTDLKALIEGLFSADRTIDNGHRGKDKGNITYTTIHENFGKDIRRILWQVGITCTTKRFQFTSIWGKKCSGLKISLIGTKSRKEFSKIGFYEKYKNNRMFHLDNSNNFSSNDKFHGIPYIGHIIQKLKTKKNIHINDKKRSYQIKSDLTKSNSVKDSMINTLYGLFDGIENYKIFENYINHNWIFDQIVDLKETGKKNVYDIINSETQSYVIEGLVSHNCKWWIPEYAQEVVDHFKNKIQFVQFGEIGENHYHPPLQGVINLVGKTDIRQFMRLSWHADGTICPVTFAMHLAAAQPHKEGKPIRRPCVVTAGGREVCTFTRYTHHGYLHANGYMKCCDNGGCWKSRTVPLGDGDSKDNELCVDTVDFSGRKVQRCMKEFVTPELVIQEIEKYYQCGMLRSVKKTVSSAKSKKKVDYEQEELKKNRLVFTAALNNDPGFMIGCKTLIKSINKYHPEADIIIFLEKKDTEFEKYCQQHKTQVIYFDEKIPWFLSVANSRKDLKQDTTYYHHPQFKPIEGIDCPFDINNNDPGFDKIRHRHHLNFKAYCTGWCILHENYEYVCHIDTDAFLVSNISDIYERHNKDNTLIAFQDNTDELPNVEKLYHVTRTTDFDKHKYAFNAGVVFYHNGDAIKEMIEEFMFYIECPYRWDISGTLCDQGVLRAITCKHHMLGNINYYIEDKTNWNPIHGFADSLKKKDGNWINNKNGKKQYIIHTSTCKIWYNEWPSSDIHKPWTELGGTYISKYGMHSLPQGCLTVEEINVLYEIILKKYQTSNKFIKILEIGTYFGKSAIGLGHLLKKAKVSYHIDTVDTFAPSIDFTDKTESYNTTKKSVEDFELTNEIRLVRIPQGCNLTKILEQNTYDVIFIDGEHQFGFVYADCHYADKLTKKTNSIIMGDDYGGQVKDAIHSYFVNEKININGKIWWFHR